jgi:hypothetical protein
LTISSIITLVLPSGAPRVITQTWSNSRNARIIVTVPTKISVLRSCGTVMNANRCQGVAPSIAAAS